MTMITKEQIIQTIKDTLEPLEFVNAMFEGGAVAFGREDEFSDIDLHIDAADERSHEVLPLIEQALLTLGPLKDKFEVPEPNWHGHHQTFFRLEELPEWLMIDCAVMKNSAEDKFLEPELHGHHVVHFDKIGVYENLPTYSFSNTEKAIKGRLPIMGQRMQMFSHMPPKYLRRGKNIDGIHFYQGLILRLLLGLIRIKYDPKRHDWSARYLSDHLPAEDLQKYEQLLFVAGADDLKLKIDEALAWFWKLHAEMLERYEI